MCSFINIPPNINHLVRHEEAEKQVFAWGSYTRFSENCCHPSVCRVGLTIVLPGKTQPEHFHDSVDELHFLILGEGEYTIGDKKYLVKSGDLIYIPAGVEHYVAGSSWNPLYAVTIKVPGSCQHQLYPGAAEKSDR